ncbi:MAG TPA: YncE family protein [Gemmatimonadaceae bacterium]|nr:YncE family protein [Gemmatimonadaceae bacterium]
MSTPRRVAPSFLSVISVMLGFVCAPAAWAQAAHPAADAGAGRAAYHVVNTYTLGGEGGWDYLALDTVGHRLFIARGDRAMVVNPDNGKVLGEVSGIDGAHGVAFDYASGHGFATSGRDSSVVMFDLKTLAVLGRAKAAEDADGILFDPATKRVFSFNGDAQSSSVIDGATGRNVGTVDLGAKPEFGVSDGHGKVYVNLESTGEIAEIDAAAMRVTRKWSIAPCQSPTGLAIDVAHDRLFSGCRNHVMAISDAKAGKLVTTMPIGAGVDACRFDAATSDAFSSNGGDGTITVIHEDSPNHYTVVQTVPTMQSARTMELNPSTHALYTVGAKFGPMPAQPAAGQRRRRPPMVPGSFTLLVLQR